MAELFFTTETLSDHVLIPEEEARHLVKVLRYSEGDRLYFTDGRGTMYSAILEDTHYTHCRARIEKKEVGYKRRPYRLQIAIAPTKNTDRLEWFLEKATEIGIDRITPMLCRRSERKALRTDRFEKILVSAMKQSFQAYLPQLDEPIHFDDVLKSNADQRFICHYESAETTLLKNASRKGGDVLVLIGPEGDFDNAELASAKAAGFQCVSLGENRLRTETAGLIACSTIALINQ
jgi:16S rRNA (uracil1498-N3)-methyltransferase